MQEEAAAALVKDNISNTQFMGGTTFNGNHVPGPESGEHTCAGDLQAAAAVLAEEIDSQFVFRALFQVAIYHIRR
jgi:inosine-uridine nucleoside N-ribohydrolase